MMALTLRYYLVTRIKRGLGIARLTLGALCVLCGVSLVAPIEARSNPTPNAHRLPVEAFAALGKLRNVILSPSGSQYLALETVGDEAKLVVHQTDEAADINPTFISADRGKFSWAVWLSDERIVAGVIFRVRIGDGFRQVARIVSVKSDGTEFRYVGRRSRPGGRSLGNDRIVSFIPNSEAEILLSMQRSSSLQYPSVYRVNVVDGTTRRVQGRIVPVENWAADLKGQVRLGIGYKDTRMIVYARGVNDTEWRIIRDYDVYRDPSFIPLSFGENENALYVLSNHETDLKAIYKFDLQTGQFDEKIYAHPKVDVNGAIISLEHQSLVGVAFVDEQSERVYFDQQKAQSERQVGKLFPDRRTRIVSSNSDETLLVVLANASWDPGSYYLVNPAGNDVSLIGHVQPLIAPEKMARVEPINYRARDGKEIFGYLTRPITAKNKNLPMVVLPHGGPTIRDTMEFNSFVQFLANRGYAVLQMNFRGSAGFGRRHLQAGYRQWGLKIQDDITDGVQWAIEQGIADPSRICIFGGSFGGYAAMMGAALSPRLYRCAVSLNGVTDIMAWLRTRQAFTSANILKTTVGDRYRERSRLRASSPLYNVASIDIPVLVVHGEKDEIVSVSHSRRFVRALRRQNKDVEAVYFKNGNHELADPQDRTQFLLALERFLDRQLAPAVN